VVPARDAVIVLSAWHWTLTERRRYSLERWVESGGRLVVTGRLAGGEDEFSRWSGITRSPRDAKALASGLDDIPDCRDVTEFGEGISTGARYMVCDTELSSHVGTTRRILWGLRDDKHTEAVRVPVGRGWVTAINSSPILEHCLLAGDHGRLFVTATGLRREDEVARTTILRCSSSSGFTEVRRWCSGSPRSRSVCGGTARASGRS
jgi:hypothetical protein